MVRKSKIFILCLLALVVSSASATQIVATITSYNSVELSGAASEGVIASFENTNHSKGQITAGNKATMTLSNIWDGAIVTMVFYVKSNAKSGAGSLHVTLDNETIAEIPESSYAKWNNTGFSTDYQPFVFNGYWANTIDSKLVCEIEATENSLTWEKLEVYVAEYMPSLCSVNLSWLAADGSRQYTVIEETEVGAGIKLPDCEVKTLKADKEWYFVGWSREEIIDMRSAEPDVYYPNQKFYPSDKTTLFAVYCETKETIEINQATSFQSGEYALVMAVAGNYYMASSEVTDKKIFTRQCGIVSTQNGYQLAKQYVPVDNRYQLDFANDSLTIKYLYTGANIGHSGTKLANNKAKWGWQENKNHSLELSYDGQETASGLSARVLWLEYDDNPYFDVVQLNLNAEYEFLILFETSDIPTSEPTAKYTSYPFGWNAINDPVILDHAPAKKLRNGILYIERDGQIYTILGHKNTSICN